MYSAYVFIDNNILEIKTKMMYNNRCHVGFNKIVRRGQFFFTKNRPYLRGRPDVGSLYDSRPFDGYFC